MRVSRFFEKNWFELINVARWMNAFGTGGGKSRNLNRPPFIGEVSNS